MNRLASLLTLALALGASAGCCHGAPQLALPHVVAVREEQIRSDDYPLPLNPDNSAKLTMFLGVGGNRDAVGVNAPDPVLLEKYKPLVALLGQNGLTPESLASDVFKPWFHGQVSGEVVDTRDKRPSIAGTVHAASDAAYWWVFRSTGGILTKLVVSKAGPSTK